MRDLGNGEEMGQMSATTCTDDPSSIDPVRPKSSLTGGEV